MIPYTANDMIRAMDREFDLTANPRRRRSILRFIVAVHSRIAR